MSKKCYRYYGGLLVSQANWLYCVEFIGQKSKESAADYARFLEDFGYRVFFKNSNLNWNVGKVVARPWAERGGRLATTNTTLNRELLIVEKESDGKPFELHTTFEDKAHYCKQMRRPWLYLFLVSVILDGYGEVSLLFLQSDCL